MLVTLSSVNLLTVCEASISQENHTQPQSLDSPTTYYLRDAMLVIGLLFGSVDVYDKLVSIIPRYKRAYSKARGHTDRPLVSRDLTR